MSARTIALVLAALLLGAVRPAAQDGPSPTDRRVAELLRERSPEERARLEQRLRTLRELPPEERGELLRRARGLERFEREVLGRAPEELRRSRQHGPDHGRWRDHFERACGERGRHLRERLPEPLRRRLEDAPPSERMRILHRELSERDRRERSGLGRLARKLGLSDDELVRLKDLPRHERFAEILRLRRAAIERRIAEEGLPPGVDAAVWESLRALPDEEFFRGLRELGLHERPPRADHGRRHGEPGPRSKRRRDGR